jgi:hypothetical protein
MIQYSRTLTHRVFIFLVNYMFYVKWLSSARAMMEAEWAANNYVPATMEEYMSNAMVYAAFGTFVCPPVYLVGLSEEYTQLLRLTNVIGCLMNDSVIEEEDSNEKDEQCNVVCSCRWW